MPDTFVRFRYTWLAYLMLALFAFYQSGQGPLVPFLRAEFNLNYAVTGLHLSAFALGTVLAGVLGDRVSRRWGRRVVLWSGATGMALAVLGLIVSQRAALTISSVLMVGLLGTLVLIMVQASLSDLHGRWRSTALTEANVGAAVAGVMAPLAIGGMQQAGLGWRWALGAVAALVLLIALINFRKPVPEAAARAESPDVTRAGNRLPAAFWIYWAIIVLVVSVEWCVIFWGADFLENVMGFSKVTAATLLTVFWVAYVLGRLAASRLTRRYAATFLLLAAFVLSLVSFPLFWLAPVPEVSVAGLFLVGLGFSSLFPLALSAGIDTAPHLVDAASSRVSLAVGLAMLTVPLLLGSLADRVGIQAAFALVLVFLATATVITWLLNRKARRQSGAVSR